jgi:hypothetical protein
MKTITHIERSGLPWRAEQLTECGLDAPRHPTWTREEVVARYKEWGAQRLSLHVCMTCWSTFARHATWEDDPASCIVRHATPMTLRWGVPSEDKRRFADELRAIAALIAAHREEFDALVDSYAEVVDLKEVRRERNRRPA